MKVNGVEMNKMIEDIYKPGFEMVEASNILYGLAKEYGFAEDPRYKEANEKITKAMLAFQSMGFERVIDLCKKNAIIDKVNEGRVGRYLVNKAKEDLA